MTKEFILNTLLPYKIDRENCAFEPYVSGGGKCCYLTKDGKKCAVGVHMMPGIWQDFVGGFDDLRNEYSPNQFLTGEAISQDIPNEVWMCMQEYHDCISLERYDKIPKIISSLESYTQFDFSELKID